MVQHSVTLIHMVWCCHLVSPCQMLLHNVTFKLCNVTIVCHITTFGYKL